MFVLVMYLNKSGYRVWNFGHTHTHRVAKDGQKKQSLNHNRNDFFIINKQNSQYMSD